MTEYVHLISSFFFVRSLLVFFPPGSQFQRNLQLIKIGKFLFILRSSRPEYTDTVCGKHLRVKCSSKREKKIIDDEQEKGKTAQQNFCGIGKFLWINKMKNELNDCAHTHTYIMELCKTVNGKGSLKFLFPLTLNLIGFFRVRKQTDGSLCFRMNKLHDVRNAMRCNAIVIGYAVHILCKIDAFCAVYNFLSSSSRL